MTLAELTEKDLTCIIGKYFYLRGDSVFNLFVGSKVDFRGYTEFEPLSLKELLTELSDKVQFGNNYTSVAKCLKLPYELQHEAQNMDRSMIYGLGA